MPTLGQHVVFLDAELSPRMAVVSSLVSGVTLHVFQIEGDVQFEQVDTLLKVPVRVYVNVPNDPSGQLAVSWH